MNKTALAPRTTRRKYPKWVHLILAGMIGVGVGIGQGVAAPGGVPGKPIQTIPGKPIQAIPDKPIQTKSGRNAAIKDAAQAILQAQPVTGFAAPVSRQAGAISPMAAPIGPTDQTAVPHYFGPFPNWALSPLTLPDATVTIAAPPAGGTQATATATVGTGGAVTGITITNTGSGYTSNPGVTIAGAGTNATATATVTLSGSVTAINVSAGGAGYTAPVVTLSGGGGTATPVVVGNALVDRAYPTDTATGRYLVRSFPLPLPTGQITNFPDPQPAWKRPPAKLSMPMCCGLLLFQTDTR